MAAPFVHLHCHSEYSILDGACRIRELVKRAGELEMPAVTVTDHGSMAGAVELYRTATKAGIKPIVGCEVYLVDDRFQKEARGERSLGPPHAAGRGYERLHNLVKLVTTGYLEGYHYKPRVDFDLLQRYSGGLIALTGCLSGRVCRALLDGDQVRARNELDRLVQIFGRDQVYIEIQDAGIEAHRRVNPGLLQLADETGLPTVGTGDVHYLRAEDADPHEALLCIQTGDELANPKRFRFENKEFFFKTPDEMAHDLAPYGRELLRPTLEIAERCNVQIELGTIRLPTFDVPEGEDAFAYLTRLCEAGLAERYGAVTPDAEAAPRLRAADHPRDGLRRLLPDRLGLRPLREVERDRRRPGPRLGGRLAGRVRPAHHRRRPDPVRAAVRALPQPGPQVDARHRHRLLRGRPRARHELRGRQVRRASAWRRSSRSASSPRRPPRATRAACSACRSASSTASRR